MLKIFQCLGVMAIIVIAGAGASQPAEAGNLPARAGKSDYPVSEPHCWAPHSGTVRNICPEMKVWWMPLISVVAGAVFITVTAEAANNSSNVECAATGANREGTIFTFSGWRPLPQFGVAANISLYIPVPTGGTGMVDCLVNPGGKIHTLNW